MMKGFATVLFFTLSVMVAILAPNAVQSQTIVKGIIRDADTGKGVPFASVAFKGTKFGAVTDLEGKYFIQCGNGSCTKVRVQNLGYKPTERTVEQDVETILNISLEPDVIELKEAEVRRGEKQKYRNKNNPAVDLVREVIARKDSNRMEARDYLEFEEYEKLQMALSSISEKLKNRKLFKKYAFMFDNVDTTKIDGKSVLPIYLKETISQNYWSRDPERKKQVIKGEQQVSFEEYLNDDGLTTYLNYLYSDINIYDNNIPVLTNMFLSPIANGAPTFYEFFITDTVSLGTERLVELSFIPRNTSDFVFQGHILVTLDGNYAVRGVDMGLNDRINLNWVRELRIDQRYEPIANGRYQRTFSRMKADFGISKNGGGIYGERSISWQDVVVDNAHPVEFYDGSEPTEAAENEKSDAYWENARHEALTEAESKVYQNVDSLKKMPSFKRTMDIATLLLAGYKSFNWWELGPVNTFYSFNPVEGFRARLGGRTTTRFSEKLYFEGYGAYGFKDERWKYLVGTTYSFTGRSIWRFPVHSLSSSYQQDTKIPGQELQFVQEDFILLSFKRGLNDKWLYNNIFKVDYLHEFENHFSYRVYFNNWAQAAAGGLRFIAGNENLDLSLPASNRQVITSEAGLELRFAPGEKFYEGKTYRIPMPNKNPILTLRAGQGIKGIMNSQYEYTNLRLNIYKRFYFSQFGYADVTTEGGYVGGKVPYPLLAIHRANQTYSYQLQSYNLMNFLEFVSDEYASANVDYFLNGALFNKIPLLKKLKWREVATIKVIYGSLRSENNPSNDSTLLRFPVNADGITTTFAMDRGPYMEGSVGIANIFKLIRVDLVRRFTYLENENVAGWGVRARFKLDF